ncbi:MAG: F0F1 ATP synthase subunit delta [Candidatus Omnitrophota bacterium]
MSPEVKMMLQLVVVFVTFITAGGFFLALFLKRTADQHVVRLNRETETVRAKQSELNTKIKQADEELVKRRTEADDLVAKMKEDAEEAARAERDKIVGKARQEAEEIIEKAQRTKDDIRKVLEQEMEMKAVDFMMILLKEIFSERVRKGLNRDLIEEFLESLQKTDMDMLGEDITEADVAAPAKLDPDIEQRLKETLQKKLGREITLNIKEDPEVLAGVVLRFGSLRLDGTLANLMKGKGVEMKERLERGLL